MQQFVKTPLVLTVAFPGNLPGFFPSNPANAPYIYYRQLSVATKTLQIESKPLMYDPLKD